MASQVRSVEIIQRRQINTGEITTFIQSELDKGWELAILNTVAVPTTDYCRRDLEDLRMFPTDYHHLFVFKRPGTGRAGANLPALLAT